jgi:hypothetical protein
MHRSGLLLTKSTDGTLLMPLARWRTQLKARRCGTVTCLQLRHAPAACAGRRRSRHMVPMQGTWSACTGVPQQQAHPPRAAAPSGSPGCCWCHLLTHALRCVWPCRSWCPGPAQRDRPPELAPLSAHASIACADVVRQQERGRQRGCTGAIRQEAGIASAVSQGGTAAAAPVAP